MPPKQFRVQQLLFLKEHVEEELGEEPSDETPEHPLEETSLGATDEIGVAEGEDSPY